MTDAIQHLYNRLRTEAYPTAQMGGIYANKPGYHNKRDALPSSDYSVQQPDDQAGSGQNASGLDITLNPADMRHLTQRLIDLTHAADPRIQVMREFFGTQDGHTVTGRDVRTMRVITSDPSHTWHVHASLFRRWAGDHTAMDALAGAIIGTNQEDDMTPDQDALLREIFNLVTWTNQRTADVDPVIRATDGVARDTFNLATWTNTTTSEQLTRIERGENTTDHRTAMSEILNRVDALATRLDELESITYRDDGDDDD